MLFVSAKVSHLAHLPQGDAERRERVTAMVNQMDDEGFGSCTNYGECEAACPKVSVPITSEHSIGSSFVPKSDLRPSPTSVGDGNLISKCPHTENRCCHYDTTCFFVVPSRVENISIHLKWHGIRIILRQPSLDYFQIG